MKILRRLVFLLAIAMALLPQFNFASPPRTPIPATFDKNSVQFIFTSPTGTNDFKPLGTCFTVDVTAIHKPNILRRVWWLPPISVVTYKHTLAQHNRYIVTAKHVLFDEKGNLRPNVYFRADTQGGRISYSYLNSDFTNGNDVILSPDDKHVDLVAFRQRDVTSKEFAEITQYFEKLPKDVKPNVGAFDSTLVLDEKQIKKYGISEGEQMFFVGLFTPFYGAKRNIPICRFGRLSMLPDEPIEVAKGDFQNLYLMETSAFGGNSGSPAFFSFGQNPFATRLSQLPSPDAIFHDPGHTKILFAGVVNAYFPDYEPIGVVNVAAMGISKGNTGIASVVPAHYLYEIIYSKAEQQYRERFWNTSKPAGYK